jgi:hypothetical protein
MRLRAVCGEQACEEGEGTKAGDTEAEKDEVEDEIVSGRAKAEEGDRGGWVKKEGGGEMAKTGGEVSKTAELMEAETKTRTMLRVTGQRT